MAPTSSTLSKTKPEISACPTSFEPLVDRGRLADDFAGRSVYDFADPVPLGSVSSDRDTGVFPES